MRRRIKGLRRRALDAHRTALQDHHALLPRQLAPTVWRKCRARRGSAWLRPRRGTSDRRHRGALKWANYPRRREDGVWTPNLRGFLTTRDGKDILISIHGQSVDEQAPGRRRAVTARIELTTEVESYRWLNTCFVVGEGEIDEEREEWWLTTYVCVNEEAQGPPSIGVEPPARFRQRGSAPP